MSTVHPTAIVDPGARLGEGVEIGSFCIVGPDVTLGRGCKLHSHVVMEGVTTLGEDCTLHPFVNLGGPPQHLGHKGEPTRLDIGARNIFRENVSIHTGTVMGHGVTRVGDDCLFMVSVHVGHDAVIGNRVTLAPSVAVGGHAEVADFVFLGGLAAVHQFSRIGRSAFIGGGGIVTKDVIPYGSVWGNHAHLEGLNLIGLKRRGFDRERINAMRAAYRLLFADEGTFQERLDDVAETYSDIPEVVEILDFIRVDANRALCLPRRET